MNTSLLLLAPIAALVLVTVPAEQSPQLSQPTPTPQGQVQPAPCTTPQNPKSHSAVVNKWKKKLDDMSNRASGQIGLPLPTSDDIPQAQAAPCPPKAVPTVSPAAQPAPVLHLPTGVTTTWLCNPIITSIDPSHTVTFITPNELTVAEPAQANAFEADAAKADAKATVSCANLRRDPKNNKVFLAQ